MHGIENKLVVIGIKSEIKRKLPHAACLCRNVAFLSVQVKW